MKVLVLFLLALICIAVARRSGRRVGSGATVLQFTRTHNELLEINGLLQNLADKLDKEIIAAVSELAEAALQVQQAQQDENSARDALKAAQDASAAAKQALETAKLSEQTAEAALAAAYKKESNAELAVEEATKAVSAATTEQQTKQATKDHLARLVESETSLITIIKAMLGNQNASGSGSSTLSRRTASRRSQSRRL